MFKLDKSYFFLTNKEEEIMNILWGCDRSLSASEITAALTQRTDRSYPPASMQNILMGLIKKQALKVTGEKKIGRVYGRVFSPTLSKNQYAVMQFKRYHDNEDTDGLFLIFSILGKKQSKSEIVGILQKIIRSFEEA